MEKQDVRMLLRKQREHKEQEAEMAFKAHHQYNEKPKYNQQKSIQDSDLLCACTGLKCEGVCREQHLYRKRMANPTAKKNENPQKSWADKCPESYANSQKA